MPKWWDNFKDKFRGKKHQRVVEAPIIAPVPEPTPIPEPTVEEPVPIVLSNYSPNLPPGASDPAFVPDRWASPSGGGDGLSESTPYQIADFWGEVSGSVRSLGLLDGTYTGVNSMITPTNGLNGASGDPIIVRAINDGGAVIDGSGVRWCVELANNDWFELRGFNIRNGLGNGNLQLNGASSNNIVRRVISYDALDNDNAISMGTASSGTSNNLFEDCACFGKGRKMWEHFGTTGQLTLRRCWGRWMRDVSAGPKAVITALYTSSNCLIENCMFTWDETEMLGASVSQPYGLISAGEGAPDVNNIKVYGSIGYVRSVDECDDFIGAFVVFENVITATIEHCVIYLENHAARVPFWLLNYTGGDPNKFLTRTTEIGGTTSTIQNEWNISGRLDLSSPPTGVDNIWNGSSNNGARVYYRYVDGVLTGDKLWPWPMDDRINAAITQSGRNPDDFFGAGNKFTDLMEDIFGAIP